VTPPAVTPPVVTPPVVTPPVVTPPVVTPPVVAPTAVTPTAVTPTGAQNNGLAVNKPIGDIVLPPGARVAFTIPSDAFAASNTDQTVQLTAGQANGAALPGWLSFNPEKGQFEGTPPPGARVDLAVKIVARDQNGHEAVQVIEIRMGDSR